MSKKLSGIFLSILFLSLMILFTPKLNNSALASSQNTTESIEWSKTYGSAEGRIASSVIQTNDGGYAIAGTKSGGGFAPQYAHLTKTDSAGNVTWSKDYGEGHDIEIGYSVIQTSDAGYIIAGRYRGDFWLIKTDSDGNEQWNKTYGGEDIEAAFSVVQTCDGGYALAGGSLFVKTDSSGNQLWNKTFSVTFSSMINTIDGGYALAGDSLFIKLDSVGNQLWSKTFGTSFSSVIQTSDSGYALTGGSLFVKTNSDGNQLWNKTFAGSLSSLVQTSDGGYALTGGSLFIKIDSVGNQLWNKTFLTPSSDNIYIYLLEINDVIEATDGGYVLAGFTGWNEGGKSMASSYTFWLTKISNKPELIGWSKTYDGTGSEWASCVILTSDGGYALAGTTVNNDGNRDFYLVKVDSAGNLQWNQTYGGTGCDEAYSVVQTIDGGYAIAGDTDSYGAGFEDFWLVKVDSLGNPQWNQSYGGSGYDEACSVVQTNDGGYGLAGSTTINDILDFFWLIKVDSAGIQQWNTTYCTYFSGANSMVKTIDGGFALAGSRTTNIAIPDFVLVKTDSAGSQQWIGTYNAKYEGSCDWAKSVVQTSDGGYVIVGQTYPYTEKDYVGDFLLVKTDSAGNLQWDKTYGSTTLIECPSSVIQTNDGGYALAGGNLFIKTDLNGNQLWNKTLEGYANSMVQTSDGGYALAGSISGDFWLIKVSAISNTKVETPVLTVSGGVYSSSQNVTISCGTSGAIIYYTLDGSEPSSLSTVYSSPILISENVTIRAIACNPGMNDSEITRATYTIITSSDTSNEPDSPNNTLNERQLIALVGIIAIFSILGFILMFKKHKIPKKDSNYETFSFFKSKRDYVCFSTSVINTVFPCFAALISYCR